MDIKRQEHPALFDFEVINDGTFYQQKTGNSLIYRASVPKHLVKGDEFNVRFGDDSYVPRQKTLATWVDKRTPEELSESELIEVVKKAILQSDIYKALNTNSEHFYNEVANRYSTCSCAQPRVDPGDDWKLIAADLNYPWYPRGSSRWVVFLTVCVGCYKPVTSGTGFGSFNTVGSDELKAALEKQFNTSVSWDKVITNHQQLKKNKKIGERN